MKFELDVSDIYSKGYSKAVANNFFGGKVDADGRPFIEINTLEELIALVRNTEKCRIVIEKNSNRNRYEFTIEDYNYWRE